MAIIFLILFVTNWSSLLWQQYCKKRWFFLLKEKEKENHLFMQEGNTQISYLLGEVWHHGYSQHQTNIWCDIGTGLGLYLVWYRYRGLGKMGPSLKLLTTTQALKTKAVKKKKRNQIKRLHTGFEILFPECNASECIFAECTCQFHPPA